jgi:hypothetical protein
LVNESIAVWIEWSSISCLKLFWSVSKASYRLSGLSHVACLTYIRWRSEHTTCNDQDLKRCGLSMKAIIPHSFF